MEKFYLTQEDGKVLSFPYEWHQTLDHKFEMSRVANEAVTIKTFISAADERQMGLEILVLLLDYTYATKSQMERLLAAKGIDYAGRLDDLLTKYISYRFINRFTLGAFEMDHIPEDAFSIYCLDHASRHILSHFYRDDVAVTWRSTNALRGAEIISKYLATNEFYLSLLTSKKNSLVSFQPTVNYSIRVRDIRFSAAFRIMNGFTPRDFILEVVRSRDLFSYWDKKVNEHISPFIEDGFWSRYFRTEPTFIFLAEDLEQGERLSTTFYRKTQSSKFLVTTDPELLKGIQNTTFYRYEPNASPALIPVDVPIFKADE